VLAIAASAANAQEPEPSRATPQDRLAAPGDTKPTVKLALDAIKADRGGLSAAQRKGVNRRLTSISAALKRGDSSDAVAALSSLRRGVGGARGVSGDAGRPRMNVAAAALQAEALLKFGKGTKACGGGVTPPRTALARQVSESSPAGLMLRVGLPTPKFDAQTIGGKSHVALRMGDLDPQGAAGQPALPTTAFLVALPEGATPKLTTEASSAITLAAVDLAPAQQDAPDQELTSESPELQRTAIPLSTETYGKRTPFPPRRTSMVKVGDIGGLDLMLVRVAPAQYVPGSRTLRVFTEAKLKLSFSGGTGKFADQRLTTAANVETAQVLASQVLNFKTVAENLGTITVQPCGEDLVIITIPELRGAADRLANIRNEQGIATQVFNVGDPAVGSTKESIRNFIQGRVQSQTCAKRAKWVVLLGDTPALPTWTLNREITLSDGVAVPTDLPYSTASANGFLPNVAVGRIPAGTLDQAVNAMNKQIFYGALPPSDPNFYKKATVAGFFQAKECSNGSCSFPNGVFRESRRYMSSVVKVRSGLQAFGKTVDTYVTKNAEAKPLWLNNGALLPPDLIFTTNAYNGTGTQIRDALNDGRWLLVHRDHGGASGWGDPSFNATNVGTLSNGNSELPLVLSINCQTGKFDLGGQGTFADALLLYAKIKLLITYAFDTEGAKYFRDMMRLYQYFGDPSVRIHTSQ